MKWENSCITMNRRLLSVWEGWHWDDNKGGWLDPELYAKPRREEVEHIRRHEDVHKGSPEKRPNVRREGHPSRQWRRTRDNQGSPTYAWRRVAKEYQMHARSRLYASTLPLEALKVVLAEIATGKRGGKVVALVDVRRAYFYAPARRRVFRRTTTRGLPARRWTRVRAVAIQPVRHARRRTKLGRRNWHLHSVFSNRRDEARTRECGKVASRERTLLQPCMETISHSVENGRRWKSSSK